MPSYLVGAFSIRHRIDFASTISVAMLISLAIRLSVSAIGSTLLQPACPISDVVIRHRLSVSAIGSTLLQRLKHADGRLSCEYFQYPPSDRLCFNLQTATTAVDMRRFQYPPSDRLCFNLDADGRQRDAPPFSIRHRIDFASTTSARLAILFRCALSVSATGSPLPYPEPDRLVYIGSDIGHGFNPFSYTRDYAAWARHNRTLVRVAGYMWFPANFTGGDEAERVNCALATASLFPLLGVQAAIGRNFLPEEDRPGGTPVAMLEHGFWKRRFGGDPSVIGKFVTVDANCDSRKCRMV